MAKAGALRCYWVTIVVVGACLLVVSGALYWYYGKMVKDRTATLQKRNVLSRNSTALDAWQHSESPPIYRSFYVFNVSNAEEVRIRGEKPNLVEQGPYKYRVWTNKTELEFVKNDTRLSYRADRSYEFVASENSTFGAHDNVTVLNIPAITLATWARFSGWQREVELAQIFFELHVPLFVTLPVSDLLWGYEDPLWGSPRVRRFFERKLHIHLSNDTHFGMFYETQQDSGTEHSYEIFTGVDRLDRVRDVFKWNGSRLLSMWPSVNTSNQANMINGTDGSAWPPNMNDDEPHYVFDPLWCRSIGLTGNRTSTESGLTVQHYVQSASVYDNEGYDKEFCTPGRPCMLLGVLNATVCRGNMPLMHSEPHFYQANRIYLSRVDGLHPDQELHESTVDVDKLTGSVLRSSRKLQMNVYTKKLRGFWWTDRIPDNAVIPVVWMEEQFEMSAKDRDQLHSKLDQYKRYRRIFFILMIFGGVLVALGLLLAAVSLLSRRPTALTGRRGYETI